MSYARGFYTMNVNFEFKLANVCEPCTLLHFSAGKFALCCLISLSWGVLVSAKSQNMGSKDSRQVGEGLMWGVGFLKRIGRQG